MRELECGFRGRTGEGGGLVGGDFLAYVGLLLLELGVGVVEPFVQLGNFAVMFHQFVGIGLDVGGEHVESAVDLGL